MQPPLNAEVFDTPISKLWFDDDGILHAVSNDAERKLEYYQEVVEVYKRLLKDGKKLYLLAEYSESMPMPKEVIDFIAKENPKYLSAIAVVSNERFGSSPMHIFLKMNFSGFPVMKFTNSDDAKNWLKEIRGKS